MLGGGLDLLGEIYNKAYFFHAKFPKNVHFASRDRCIIEPFHFNCCYSNLPMNHCQPPQ